MTTDDRTDRLPPPGRPHRRHHRSRQRHRPRHRPPPRLRGRATSSAATSTRRAGKAAAEEVGGTFVKVDVTDPEQVEALFKTAYDTYGSRRHRLQQRGHLAARRRLHPHHRTRGLEAASRRSTSPPSTCAARPPSPTCGSQGRGSIINTASFVARMGAATSQISYTASKGGVLAMSRELGVQFAREGIRVNALCPGPGQHPAAPGAVRQGPRARRPPPRPHPAGPVRRGRRDRRRGRLPRQRRLLVRQRHRLPGRRRHPGRVRHPAVGPTPPVPSPHGSPAVPHPLGRASHRPCRRS